MQRLKGHTRSIVAIALLAISLTAGWIFLQSSANRQESSTSPLRTATAKHGTAEQAIRPAAEIDSMVSEPSRAVKPSTLKEIQVKGSDIRVRLSAPLEPVYKAALKSTNAEDRTAAFRMAALCVAKEGEIAALTKADAAQLANVNPEQAQNLLTQRDDAISRLRTFCATGDASNFLSALKNLPKPTLGPIFRSAYVSNNGQAQDQQRNFQAFTQILANPSLYATQFDAWLDSDAFSALARQYGLNSNLTIQAGNLLIERLAPDPDIIQIRKWKHCIDALLCENSSNNKKVLRAVDDIENNIRTQRWDSLLIRSN